MTPARQPTVDDTTRTAVLQNQAPTGIRAWLTRISEPHILFPAITILILSVIWSATFNLINVERVSAETAATAATLELVNTYEAQVVRALREIDHTLKFVKYAYETKGAAAALPDLRTRDLLPSDLLFVVRIVNSDGIVLASTRPAQMSPAADQGSVSMLRHTDALWVDEPRKQQDSQAWTLQFGRRLDSAEGKFLGAVVLTVDASYFVSGYDTSRLGHEGFLGLLGTDGVFRARRTGDTLAAGNRVDYMTVVPGADQGEPTVSLTDNTWDGVRRYTGAQQLYDFPMAVIVGLSVKEQLAAAQRSVHLYLWRAAIGSALLILLTTLLGRLSRQLARSRQREGEVKLLHEQRIEYLAYHDGLTGLPNRRLFNKLLSQALRRAQRSNTSLAVAFIDLDGFKQINDTLGHEAGDELLREVALRLPACLRGDDRVARLGGDEFVVLLEDLAEQERATAIAQRLLAAIATPFALVGQEFRVTASIGISIYPHDGRDEQTLMKNADIAMYGAKEDGKNNFQFHSGKPQLAATLQTQQDGAAAAGSRGADPATSLSAARCISHALPLIVLATIATLCHPARASAGTGDPGAAMFSLNGFGTLGVVHSSEDRADFTATLFQPNGAGYSHPWSAAVDSLIGAQLTANFTSRLSATLQIICEQNYDYTYRPHVEWANIKYQFTPDVDVRIGRIVQPTFLVSDSRNVGYANPWIRPPIELYVLDPITQADGVDVSYRLHLGEVTATLQTNYGRNLRFNFPSTEIHTRSVWGIAENVEYGAALLHLSYSGTAVSAQSPIALLDAFRQFGPQGTAIADEYQLIDKSYNILAVGATYDPREWFATAEWARSRSHSYLGTSTAWYASSGYRVGNFTPYFTYAQVTEGLTSASGLAAAGLPPSVAPTVAALDAGLNQLLATRPVQYTTSAGVRWDFIKNFDVKLQIDRIRLGAGSSGTLTNVQPGFQPGSTVYLFGIAVNFVF